MVLIEKREKFVPHTNFAAWAFRVAYFKAANWRRDMQREGRVMFREDFFQHAAAVAEEHFTDDHGMHEALRQCLKQLPPEDRALVVRKYADQESLVSQAEASGRKANTLHKAISRIRLVLRECIRRQLAGDTRPPSPTP